MTSALGRKLRELRKKKGLTLDQLAQKTGSSKSYMWELEHKDAPRPSAEKLGKIAAELGVTPEYLVDENRTSAEPEEHEEAFFRKFQAANPGVKKKLRQILDLLDEDP